MIASTLQRMISFLILIVMGLGLSAQIVAQEAVSGQVTILRDSERLTVVISGEGTVALGQIGFRVGDTPIYLRDYPGLAAVNFDQLNLPACFSLLQYRTFAPMPLDCANLPETQVFAHEVIEADVFWYNSVQAQPLIVSLVSGEQDIPAQCPGSAPRCDFDLSLFAQPIMVTQPPRFTSQERAAQWLVAELAGYSLNIDQRLSLIDPILVMLLNDPVSEEIDAAREGLYPTLADAMTDEFQRELAADMITQTSSLLASYPLPTALEGGLIDYAIDSNVDPFKVRQVYQNMNEVQWATGALMNALQAALEADPSDTEWVTYLARRVVLQRDTLFNRSMLAHLSVLNAIADLTNAYPNLDTGMDMLVWLEPRHPVTPAEYVEWLDFLTQFTEELSAERKELVAVGELLTTDQIEISRETVLQATQIMPDDPPEVVVGKIRTLREFGLIPEALDALEIYREMFSADETTEDYVRVAIAYTLEFTDMELLPSAVFVWAVDPEGVAAAAGLQGGDILIRWDGEPITGTDDFLARLEQTTLGTPINFTYLRLQDDGTFARGVLSLVRESRLGIGMLPL